MPRRYQSDIQKPTNDACATNEKTRIKNLMASEIGLGAVLAPPRMTIGDWIICQCDSLSPQTQHRDNYFEPSTPALSTKIPSLLAEIVRCLSFCWPAGVLRENRLIMARLNSGRSSGCRLVTQFPSSTTARSTDLPPAFRISPGLCGNSSASSRAPAPLRPTPTAHDRWRLWAYLRPASRAEMLALPAPCAGYRRSR
jgi:hypothetical protein